MADLDSTGVEQRLQRLDGVLGQLETTPGATAALALEAVQTLSEVYGAALARVADMAAAAPDVLDAFDRDELVRHLLVLHDVHPHPVGERVERALQRLRPYLHSHGGDVSLVAIEDGVARVALSGHCDGCNSANETMEGVIRDALLACAPELEDVIAEPATAPAHPAPVIPVDAVLRRPVTVP